MRSSRIDDLLDAWRSKPGEPFLLEGDGRRLGVRDFDLLVAQTAAWLQRQGVAPGNRVAVWLVNRVEWLALFFALARLGAIFVSVNTRYRTAELRHILTASGATMLVIQPGFRRIDFAGVLSSLDPRETPDLETVAVLTDEGEAVTPLPGRRAVAFEPAGVGAAATPAADGASDPHAPLVLFTTSGTTKSPKLVVHTQATIGLHSQRVATACGLDREGSLLLAAMPLCGVFGLNPCLGAIAGGARIRLVRTFEAAEAADLVRLDGATHLFGSDEMARRLIEQGREKLSSLRCFGFASFTPGLAGTMREASEAGLPLRGLYGSSEVNALFAVQREDLAGEERLKAGGVPTSGQEVEVRVRDQETGALLPAGQAGELEFRAPTNFAGYFRNDDATRAAVDEEGYFRTGDIGYRREDGSFVFVTRAGDAVRLSGFLVDPVEIEEILRTIDGVKDAQVVGVELDGSTRPFAFVVPRQCASPINPASVVSAAARLLAPFKVPVRVMEVEAFPVVEGANGLKIQRGKLRDLAADAMRSAEPATVTV